MEEALSGLKRDYQVFGYKLTRESDWVAELNGLRSQNYRMGASEECFFPSRPQFFNPRALAGLRESVGLLVDEVSTPGELDWDIVEGAIKDGVGAGRFWSSLARREDEIGKHELQSWISQHGLSSHMRIVAHKP